MGKPVELSLDNFLAEAGKRNLWDDFKVYYQGRHQTDPESWPLTLQQEEWWEQFSTYIYKRGVEGFSND